MPKLYLSGILLLCLQTNALAADAQTTPPTEKTFINADYMELNIESGNSIYTGNVKISQGELLLTGDTVIVRQLDDELKSITVTGKPAHYNHVTEKGESIQAESERMVYNASQNKLTMTINAELVQPGNKVSSQRIVYDTSKKVIIAGDKTAPSATDPDINQRVNITLTPKKEKQP